MTLPARFASILALAAIAGACATVQQAENIGPNDPAALAAIKAAHARAAQQKSFRARMTSVSDGKVQESTMQYAAPASAHMVMNWVKLWVGANGLPVKIESDATGRMLGFSSQSKTTILYEDYGAPVRIVAPL